MSPFEFSPKRRAGLKLRSSEILFKDKPRFVPSETSAGSRYSVPPKPDFASQMLPNAFFAALVSCRQHAWSLTTQSTVPSSTYLAPIPWAAISKFMIAEEFPYWSTPPPWTTLPETDRPLLEP